MKKITKYLKNTINYQEKSQKSSQYYSFNFRTKNRLGGEGRRFVKKSSKKQKLLGEK